MLTMQLNRIKKAKWLLITKLIYKRLFYRIGRYSLIMRPMQFDNTRSISIGENTLIAQLSWLMGDDLGKPTLTVGNNVRIGHFAHIIAKHRVTIEDSVLIADKVFISDCSHVYEDVCRPVLDQGIKKLNEVIIGEGSWLGENVCVLGVKIGKHCIIGANSVVRSDIPDYCVAVGAPARIVKRYDLESELWKDVR